MLDFLYVLIGVVFLFGGGEGLVRGSVNLAERLGLSSLIVSLVIVGFGTSVPELLVCIEAALSGAQNIALGNVAGSNIANTLLIIGTGATIYPIACKNKVINRDSFAVLIASLIFCAISFMSEINRLTGIFMVLILSSYLYYSYKKDRQQTSKEKKKSEEYHDHIVEDLTDKKDSVLWSITFAVIGIAGLIIGAKVLILGATNIARSYGISEAVIGLSLVAIGTSLPELATAVIASLRKHSDVVIGNVLGSNLFNIMAILGTTSIIAPLQVTGRILSIDIWVVLASAIILIPIIFTGREISRREGIFFLFCYAGYIASMGLS